MKTKSPSVMGAVAFVLIVIGIVAFGLIKEPKADLALEEADMLSLNVGVSL